MPWSNQGGGPWGSGGGGKGPWGSGQQPPGGGSSPPDLEELLRRSQDKLRTVLPGGSLGGRGVLLLILAALLIWGMSGFYRVDTNEYGVVLRFGAFDRYAGPGLNYHLPYPIETALTPQVTVVRQIHIGMRQVDDRRGTTRPMPQESLMLTGDENIVDVDFTVFWQVKQDKISDFLFNIQQVENSVMAVAESAMREVVGRTSIQPILTGARAGIELEVQELTQKILDYYGAGVVITQVQMQKADPPSSVIESQRDVQVARADAEKAQNEAQRYANSIVPEARGKAAKIQQDSEAYREQTVAEAKGQAARFLKVYEEYKKAPEVTRQRLYYETMEKLFSGTDKIIIDQGAATSAVPYLPLPELTRPARPAPTTQPGGAR